MEFRPGSDAPTNPNHCPVCRSGNTGVTFGFNPKRINDRETLIHDVTHVCADCDATWTAWGHTIIASRDDGPYSPEALAALDLAISEAGELRIEVRRTTGDDTAPWASP